MIQRPAEGILLSGGAVVTVDGEFTIHDPGWVHVIDDRIVAVGAGSPPADLAERVGRVIDATGCAVMPGMVNSHTHLFQTFFRGLADDKHLLEWLRDCIWPGAVHLDRDSAQLAAKVGMVENLRSGATSIIDHQYVHIDEGIDDGVCEAAAELGVRFILARGWADRNYEPTLTESGEQVLERGQRVADKWNQHDSGRIRVGLAPLIPWGCSDEAVVATVEGSRNWGAGTHVHCAETKTEVEMSLDERGVRHVEWLDNLGILGPDTQLAHSIWLTDDELDTIADSGATVVHCPVSNMYLASGVCRILDMKKRGITVALASDGPGSNNRQDMFEALKTTVLLQKLHALDAVVMQPEDAIRMACNGGARAFGAEDDIGMIEAGRKADLVVVDLRSPFIGPVHRIASALVFCATPRDITHVVVDGRILIDEGEVTVIDEKKLMIEATESARSVFQRAGISSRLTQ